MIESYIGQIMLFAGNFAPVGWAFCNGQLMPITQYQALYAILGITYGGDGRTTFALPDLRGRAPIHFGQGTGLQNYTLGKNGGVENVALLSTQMPAHIHSFGQNCSSVVGTESSPVNNYLGPIDPGIYSTTQNA